MKLRTCKLSSVKKGSRVLMRVDFNVPIVKGRVAKGGELRLTAPAEDILQFSKKGAKVILVTHLGRPAGKVVPHLSTKPLATKLSKILKRKVKHIPAVTGKQVEVAIAAMKDGDVTLLENVRFDAGEKENSSAFARDLVRDIDLYVNNAFGVCHRKHASVYAVTKYVASCAGSVVATEVAELSKKLQDPFVLILGGIKLETKLHLLHALAGKAEAVLLGSGVAAVLYSAKSGQSLDLLDYEVSTKEVAAAKKVLKNYGEKLVFPIDVQMSKSKTLTHARGIPLKMLESGEAAVDIGEHTIELYRRVLLGAKSVVWNGPVGIIEKSAGQKGTVELAKTLGVTEARSVIGGGDTLTFLEQKGLVKGFSFLSTGGGAMLAFLAGESLPGLDVLKK